MALTLAHGNGAVSSADTFTVRVKDVFGHVDDLLVLDLILMISHNVACEVVMYSFHVSKLLQHIDLLVALPLLDELSCLLISDILFRELAFFDQLSSCSRIVGIQLLRIQLMGLTWPLTELPKSLSQLSLLAT